MSHGCLCLHRSESTKFNHNGKICGNNNREDDECQKPDHGKELCWDIQPECTADSSLTEQYTYKFEEGDSIGNSTEITPPKNWICITGTCTKTGKPKDDTQLCTVIDPLVAGPTGKVTIQSSNGQDISNYKIQYACGSA